jgi:hypothetical protein
MQVAAMVDDDYSTTIDAATQCLRKAAVLEERCSLQAAAAVHMI